MDLNNILNESVTGISNLSSLCNSDDEEFLPFNLSEHIDSQTLEKIEKLSKNYKITDIKSKRKAVCLWNQKIFWDF